MTQNKNFNDTFAITKCPMCGGELKHYRKVVGGIGGEQLGYGMLWNCEREACSFHLKEVEGWKEV